ncbi:MAG: hypothetical protein L3J52_04610, partial [Proteobacteria bacterium]|nr:hypothetical protein [Pseudomonadota bacterium]
TDMPVATPANVSLSCTGGTLTAVDGSSSISYTDGSVAIASSCTISVDVSSTTLGNNINTSSDLTSSLGISTAATDSIIISGLPTIQKSFNVSMIDQGSIVSMNIIIENLNPATVLTDISFTDDLDAFVTGALAIGLPQNDVCGLGSTVTGTSVITLVDGLLNPLESCTIQINIQLPAGVYGDFINNTSPISLSIDGVNVTGDAATSGSAALTVLFASEYIPVNQPAWLLLLILLMLTVGFVAFNSRKSHT